MALSSAEFINLLKAEHRQFILNAIRGGLADYDDPMNYNPRARLDHDRRTRATIRNCHIVAHAKKALVAFSDIRISMKGNRVLFIIADQVRVSFKLLDTRLRSRNYPTKQAIAFNFQRFPELENVPEATNVVAGYTANDVETEFDVFVTCPRGGRNLWELKFRGSDALDLFGRESDTEHGDSVAQ